MEPHDRAPASQDPVSTAKRRDSFPITVKSGTSTAVIYRTPTRVRGKVYERFTVAYSIGGSRRRVAFMALEDAKTEASRIVAQKERGEIGVANLTPSDRLKLEDAMHVLAGLPNAGPATVGRLAEVVREYGTAVSLLPPGSRLEDAVRFFANRHPANMPKRTVAEVVDEMVEDRTASGCSPAHIRDLKDRLGRFADAFQMPIAEVTAPLVREYLRKLQGVNGRVITNRSRRNAQRAVTSMFHFARKQRYIPRENVDEIAEIEAPKVEALEVGVFTPAQLRQMLAVAPDDIRAALAIGAFAGLRTAELQRLDWSSVRLSDRVIVLDADITKTTSRRVVPILDNLAAWLAPLARTKGLVSPSPNDRALNHRFARSAAKVGVGWVKNGLRHSFCSYRLAVTHDPARVATEAGNSAGMVHKHYKALVTEAQGKDWFSIAPAINEGTVVAFEATALTTMASA